jgi:FAD/FMN-containing dehydrogenase
MGTILILAPPYARWVSGTGSLLRALRAAVGDAHVLTDADVVAGQVRDWTGRFVGSTPAVVRPSTVDEVAGVLRACSGAGAAVVPQGGNTGLVGGSVPLHGEVVLDLRRFDALGPVDARAGQVTAQAGVTLARLAAHARAADWDYGVDLSARESATVGGMVATNAGGVHVLRYGATRRQLLGVEAVFADGRVMRRLDGLEKDNTGYDLSGLLCGSEGTLAVITAARLRLVPRLTHVVVALLAFDDVEVALDAVGQLRRGLDSLRAVELFFQDGLDLVCERLGLGRPFRGRHVAFILVEVAARADPTPELAAATSGLSGVADVAVGADDRAARELWRYREGHTEAINLLATPHKLDVTLPADELAGFVLEVRARVADVAPDASVWLFGHAADGNIHVNVTGVAPDDDRVTDAVLQLVARRRGSISAEHGIGIAKRGWLSLVRTPAEIDAFRSIKRALDPARVLNPHVLLPS